MIYVCEKCHFTFERVGSIEQCPDCGKMSICQAKEEEINKYLQIKDEFRKTNLLFVDHEKNMVNLE
jgi:DNA-directed RNA polymerase subunit RPC12/RpoP